jgi:hypothetical protein
LISVKVEYGHAGFYNLAITGNSKTGAGAYAYGPLCLVIVVMAINAIVNRCILFMMQN